MTAGHRAWRRLAGEPGWSTNIAIEADPRIAPLAEAVADSQLHAYWSLPIMASDGRTPLGRLAMFHERTEEPCAEELQVATSSVRLASIAVNRTAHTPVSLIAPFTIRSLDFPTGSCCSTGSAMHWSGPSAGRCTSRSS